MITNMPKFVHNSFKKKQPIDFQNWWKNTSASNFFFRMIKIYDLTLILKDYIRVYSFMHSFLVRYLCRKKREAVLHLIPDFCSRLFLSLICRACRHSKTYLWCLTRCKAVNSLTKFALSKFVKVLIPSNQAAS